MNDDDDDDDDENTLENGRRHLHLLSKQIRDQKTSDHSVGSGNRQNLQAERKLLDRKPRGDRLRNRKGSPLGLTLEELDDRGLLDGGGVVPSYYTSLKQKQRRSLELQRRSSRMKSRGNEDDVKSFSLDSLMRMMRVLIRHGVSFEDLFQLIDAEGRGIIEKDQFVHVIKDFGLPFTVKEISSFAQLYSVSDEHMDYEAFLQEIISNIEPFVDGDESFTSHQPHLDPNLYGKIMRDLYRMLHDSKSRLHKSIDDIYRMFSCWDHSGKGTVTSTQFFRVLSQMHVTFSDDDQDFIVELLDVNREGKINFDGLLSYCFDTGPLDDETAHGSGGASHQHGDESVASLEGGSTIGGTVNAADLRSVTSGNAAKRPHTAAAFRTNLYGHHNDRYQDDGDSYTTSFGMSSPIGVAVGGNRGSSSPLKPLIKRPTTASARVSHTGSSAGNGNERRVKPTELRQSWQRGEDGNNFILEVSSGSDNEEMGVSDKWSSGVRNEARHEGRPLSRTNEHSEPYNRTHTRYETDSSSSLNGMTPKFFQKPNDFRRSVSGNDVEQDHAQRKLTILRSAVLERHTKHGLHLKEIFDMFDKRCIRYIDAGDLMTTSQEFKVDISFEESKSLVKRIALDGVDRVSFSEFAIWITDPDHIALQTNIQIQIAEQLEQQGREYQYLIFRVLSQGHATDATHNDPSKLSPSPATCGLVSVGAFVEALQTIGLKLSDADITRTILRFDTHGSNQCSVSRFMRMAQNNMHWKDTLETLAFHEEAVEEAQVVRHRLHSSNRRAIPANIDEETLDMAEYLGIRVLSEPHLLWIVDEAIKAPLPANWTIHQDNDGRTFFYNTNTHSTRWDHPADPELRKLRDHHRKQQVDSLESVDNVHCQSCGKDLAMYRERSQHICNHCASRLHGNSQNVAEVNDLMQTNFKTSDRAVSGGQFSSKAINLQSANPKFNTILLYNDNNPACLKKGSKKFSGTNNTVSSYLPKRTNASTEKKRAVSAGRLRKKVFPGRGEASGRNKALGRMFGDQVIEELDLAIGAGRGARSGPTRQRSGDNKGKNRKENFQHGYDQANSKASLRHKELQEVPDGDMVWL